jgi:hypothetical protein
MQNIKKTFFTSALIIISIFAIAQNNNTYSPYSRYGIGEIQTRGFATSKAMGGVSQAVRNPSGINFLNPASYSAQDTMSFILDFGFETGGTKYESLNQSVTNGFGDIHHIAISFPLSKRWVASMGISPYSQVGYQIIRYETDPIILSSIGRVKYYNKGNGGINQAYIGNAYKVTPNLSIGVNLFYYFGSLDYTNQIVFPQNKPSYYNSIEKNSIVVRDIALSIGAQYTAYINKKENTSFTFGATVDKQTKIKAKYKYLARTDLGGYPYDTISFKDSKYSSITFPFKLAIGAAYNYRNKLFTSIEYSTQDWTNTRFLDEKQPLTKSQSYRFGFEYTPNRKDLKNYLKHISYRVGTHYTNTYIKINGHQINEHGFSAGLGFPFRNNTKFNVSYEWGVRGTTNYGLVKETYGVLNLSLSFYDFWFIKRKYD